MTARRLYALVTSQGTACLETTLTSEEFANPAWRTRIECQFCRGGADDPVMGEWAEVTNNDACIAKHSPDLQEKFEGWAKANDWNLERDMSDRYEDDITRYTWQAIEALFG